MRAYLRGLADEFGESTNAIRLELNRMEEAGLLCSEEEGNKKVYHANHKHPLFNDIHSIVLKHSGITQVVEEVIKRAGHISKVWVRGDFAQGKDSHVIELVIIGSDINSDYLNMLIDKASELIKREIKYLIIPSEKIQEYFSQNERIFLIWEK